jgi:hypothetical protein
VNQAPLGRARELQIHKTVALSAVRGQGWAGLGWQMEILQPYRRQYEGGGGRDRSRVQKRKLKQRRRLFSNFASMSTDTLCVLTFEGANRSFLLHILGIKWIIYTQDGLKFVSLHLSGIFANKVTKHISMDCENSEAVKDQIMAVRYLCYIFIEQKQTL